MSKRSYTPFEVVAKLRHVDVLHSQDSTIVDAIPAYRRKRSEVLAHPERPCLQDAECDRRGLESVSDDQGKVEAELGRRHRRDNGTIHPAWAADLHLL